MTYKPYEAIGTFENGGIVIIADHASNIAPKGINLGIDESLMTNHIAVDIGVKPVSEILVDRYGLSAIMAVQSRLVIDLNRGEDDPSSIPKISDDHIIPGNDIGHDDRNWRLENIHQPYHNKISQVLRDMQPSLILSLHSFTNDLRSDPNAQRPWEIGVLYGQHESTSQAAIRMMRERGLNVGDQLPYSGKLLNYTMDRHAEALNIPYFGVEMRQDLVADTTGHERFAQILGETCLKITKMLA